MMLRAKILIRSSAPPENRLNIPTNATRLGVEEILHRRRVDAGDGDIGADAIDYQRTECKQDALLELGRLGEGAKVQVGGKLFGSRGHHASLYAKRAGDGRTGPLIRLRLGSLPVMRPRQATWPSLPASFGDAGLPVSLGDALGLCRCRLGDALPVSLGDTMRPPACLHRCHRRLGGADGPTASPPSRWCLWPGCGRRHRPCRSGPPPAGPQHRPGGPDRPPADRYRSPSANARD